MVNFKKGTQLTIPPTGYGQQCLAGYGQLDLVSATEEQTLNVARPTKDTAMEILAIVPPNVTRKLLIPK